MIECPKCKSPNDPGNKYCASCGYKFYSQKKSRSFRNFIIIVVVVFTLIIAALIVFFILNNNMSLGIFNNNANTTQVTGNTTSDQTADTIKTVSASQDQEKVLGMFGYPDRFIILFDEVNNKRIDTWMYVDIEASYIFEDGVYVDYAEYVIEDFEKQDKYLDPLDFVYGMSRSEVTSIVGHEGTQALEESTGLSLLSFSDGEIIATFTSEDKLIGIMRF